MSSLVLPVINVPGFFAAALTTFLLELVAILSLKMTAYCHQCVLVSTSTGDRDQKAELGPIARIATRPALPSSLNKFFRSL